MLASLPFQWGGDRVVTNHGGMGNSRQLLLEIAHCAIARGCLSGEDLPCAPIVRNQQIGLREALRAGEPWNGRIESARKC